MASTASVEEIPVGWLVFDVESVVDATLLANVMHKGASPEEAMILETERALKKSGGESTFIAHTFHKPVAICVLSVGTDHVLRKITCLDAPQFRSHVMVDQFWRGVCAKPHAALVTFNGRGFDLPLLELAAFDHGLDISKYWPKRARFKPQYHLDLQEELSNYGASRLYGGLNMLAKRLGLPGKQGVKGDDVAALYEAGRIDRVSGYCICDTLDTYFVFLRFERLCGRIKPSQEEELRRDAVRVARESALIYPGVSEYLEALPFYPGSSGQPAL